MPLGFFDGAVGAFGLTVRLRMGGGGHEEGDAEVVLQGCPEGGREPGVAVADDGCGESEAAAENMVDEKEGGGGGVDSEKARDAYEHFGEAVDKHQEVVKTCGGAGHGSEVH